MKGRSVQPLTHRPRVVSATAAAVCFAAVGIALVSQYRFDMQPCPWCTLQRLMFLVLGAVGLAGALARSRRTHVGVAAVGVALALAGVAAALWQHFVAAASDSCNLTLADRIVKGLGLWDLAPSVFAPTASCADAAVNLLGVPYAFWSLGVFALCGLGWLGVLRATRAAPNA